MQIDEAVMLIGGNLPKDHQQQLEEEQSFLNNITQSVMACFINKSRYADCEGCQQQWSSQKDHACLIEEVDVYVERYFSNALMMVTPEIIAAICSFGGRIFPVLDYNVYKNTHQETLREGLGDIIDGMSPEKYIAFKSFYDNMKLFI